MEVNKIDLNNLSKPKYLYSSKKFENSYIQIACPISIYMLKNKLEQINRLIKKARINKSLIYKSINFCLVKLNKSK